MNLHDLFLREHASIHSQAVAPGDPFNMDYLLEGLTERQIRLRPHGMNSLAWIFWHISRVEDGLVSCIVFGRDQLFDLENWSERLGVPTRGVSTTKDDVAKLSDLIDLESLWNYRNAIGRRTREGVTALWPDRWDAPIEVADVRRAVAAGVCGEEMEQFLPGKSRESALNWWGLNHTLMHLGQVSLLHGVVKRFIAAGE
jgi:hypothetical protein